MDPAIQLSFRRSFATVLIGSLAAVAVTAPRAQSVATEETTLMVQRAVLRLPYYGVFDLLVLS
jgi:hypothetical protein